MIGTTTAPHEYAAARPGRTNPAQPAIRHARQELFPPGGAPRVPHVLHARHLVLEPTGGLLLLTLDLTALGRQRSREKPGRSEASRSAPRLRASCCGQRPAAALDLDGDEVLHPGVDRITDSTPAPPTSLAGYRSPAYRALTVGLVLAVASRRVRGARRRYHLAVVAANWKSAFYGWSDQAFLLASLIGIVLAGTLADRVPLGQPYRPCPVRPWPGYRRDRAGHDSSWQGRPGPCAPGWSRRWARGYVPVLCRAAEIFADTPPAASGGARPDRASYRRPRGRGSWRPGSSWACCRW